MRLPGSTYDSAVLMRSSRGWGRETVSHQTGLFYFQIYFLTFNGNIRRPARRRLPRQVALPTTVRPAIPTARANSGLDVIWNGSVLGRFGSGLPTERRHI